MHTIERLLFSLATALPLAAAAQAGCGSAPVQHNADSAAVVAFVQAQRRQVLSFAGYSGAGYEDQAAMLALASRTLDALDPAQVLVNIGATAEGIGAVYALAKQRGFTTLGIVSTQARTQQVALSPCVDHVFFIADASWGGLLPAAAGMPAVLSPTSQAMVEVSSCLVAIGGGEIARDELLAARALGKPVVFHPADMQHGPALAKAARRGEAAPTDFRGAAHLALHPG